MCSKIFSHHCFLLSCSASSSLAEKNSVLTIHSSASTDGSRRCAAPHHSCWKQTPEHGSQATCLKAQRCENTRLLCFVRTRRRHGVHATLVSHNTRVIVKHIHLSGVHHLPEGHQHRPSFVKCHRFLFHCTSSPRSHSFCAQTTVPGLLLVCKAPSTSTVVEMLRTLIPKFPVDFLIHNATSAAATCFI